jgi:integrase
VIRTIPDEVVMREPAPFRRGRRGAAPPPPPDVLGPVLRVLIRTAAMSGLRRSELAGLRWRDVDWAAQRIRVRHAYVRGEYSTAGKSDLSTRRSVPMADRLVGELDAWSRRTNWTSETDLVFAHPYTGRPIDPNKVSKRFQQACRDAEVPVIRFLSVSHAHHPCSWCSSTWKRCGVFRSVSRRERHDRVVVAALYVGPACELSVDLLEPASGGVGERGRRQRLAARKQPQERDCERGRPRSPGTPSSSTPP